MGEQGTRDERRQRESPLKTERGSTTIQDGVVSKVTDVAAQDVDGVRILGGSDSQTADNLLGSVTGGGPGGNASRGVSLEVGEVEGAVNLSMAVEYGRSVHRTAEAVRGNVIRWVEELVGPRVTEVNMAVDGVFFAQQEQQNCEENKEPSSRPAKVFRFRPLRIL